MSSTAATCQLPRQIFLLNGSWRSPSSTAATQWLSTPGANATPTRARTGPETALTRATAHQPGLYAWYVLDARGLEGSVRERTAKEMVEKARSTGGTVIEAATLTELADRLAERGVPRETFLRTMEEYNAAAVADGHPSPRGVGRYGPCAFLPLWPLRSRHP